jgi:hypothetical protein
VHTAPPNTGGGLTVETARDRYLDENQFSVESYTAPTFRLKLLGIPLRLPNTKARQRAIPLHDLHHVATGYGTDFVGEAEIGAWELVAGCNSSVTYFLNAGAVMIGLLLAPLRVVRAARRARGTRTLYREPMPYRALLAMSVPELRDHLRLPEDGLADRPPR